MTVIAADKEKLYTKLTNIFLENIRSGKWRPGSQIPTEEELCRSFDVSKITVRRAVANLAFDGHLEKIQGRGTFVKHGPMLPGISMKTTLVEGVFLPGGTDNIALMEKRVLHGIDEELLRHMAPVNDVNIIYLSRVKSNAGVPVLLNETYVPEKICPQLGGWESEGGSVFEFLRTNGAPEIVRVRQTVEMSRPPEYRARALNTRISTPCMIIHRVFRESSGLAVAYSRTTARGDRFELVTEYERMK